MKRLDFPELIQTYEYDCGAKALQAVLAYYGVEIREELLLKSAQTNQKEGTRIKGITRTLKKYGLRFDSRSMNIEEVKHYLHQKIPVILLLQAWKSKKKADYTKDYQDGHFVVAIECSCKKIFFEDPYSLKRTYLKEQELEARWHAQEKSKKIIKYGIAVYGKKPAYNPKKSIHMD